MWLFIIGVLLVVAVFCILGFSGHGVGLHPPSQPVTRPFIEESKAKKGGVNRPPTTPPPGPPQGQGRSKEEFESAFAVVAKRLREI